MTPSEADPGPGRLATEFAALNDYLYAGGQQSQVLDRLVHLAVALVPGCSSASVSTWAPGRRPKVLASADDTSTFVNLVQHELGDGPCKTAASNTEMVRIPDLALDDRWPRFSAVVVSKTTVRGVLSFHLVERPESSALSVFSTEAGALDSDAFDIAALFAAHARVLLMHADSARRAAQFETALDTSRQIGAALGILMSAHRITQDQAFELLERTSMNLNRKLRDIAYDVTQTGVLPDAPVHNGQTK